VAKAREPEVDRSADGSKDAPSWNERGDERDRTHAEVCEPELVDNLLRAGVIDAQNALGGAARIYQLTDSRDRKTSSDTPKGPPDPGDDERVSAGDGQVDDGRDERQDSGLQQNKQNVHEGLFCVSGIN